MSACTCGGDYDFDKGDHDSWYECGFKSVPDAWAKCCECGAPLLNDWIDHKSRETFSHFEVYEPEGIEPPGPHADMTDDEWEAADVELDEFHDAHGWCGEDERYERALGHDWRCQRCEEEAEIMAVLGHCAGRPGELPDVSAQYYWGEKRRRIRWKRDRGGVLHPRPWNAWDYVRHHYRRIRMELRCEWQWRLRMRLEGRPVRVMASALRREQVRRLRWRLQMAGKRYAWELYSE